MTDEHRTVVLIVTVAATLSVAYLVALLAGRAARFAFGAIDAHRPSVPAGVEWHRRSLRVVRLTVFFIAVVILAGPALRLTGVASQAGLDARAVAQWLLASGTRIAVIALVATLILKVTALATSRFEVEIVHLSEADRAAALERVKRAQTLGRLVHNAIRTFVIGIAGLMILRQLDIDILPILTGAGVIGLAIGFGAQTLVKDVISGFFLILENQVRVGDVATINGTSGTVESITIRTIILRDAAGTVHVFPNGSVQTLANHTKDYSYSVIDLGVSYQQDLDRVVKTLEGIGRELRADPVFGTDVLDDLEVLGVDNFGPSEIVIKLRVKTRPTRQWAIGRELRRRIKKTFDQEGIALPAAPRAVIIEGVRMAAERRDASGSEPVARGPSP